MTRWLLALLWWPVLCARPVLAAHAPSATTYPGGVAVVPLPPSAQPPRVHYHGHPVLVTRRDGHWVALVGIPLTARPGRDQVRVDTGRRRLQLPIRIRPKRYREQHIRLKNRRQVNPTAEDLARIRRESARIHRALATFTPRAIPYPRFDWPVRGVISSPFGLRRFFNGQPRKPHSGIDIAAPEGTPIRAPFPGTVIEAGNFFFNGNSVFIDHGDGLITLYCHMQHIVVQPGQHVERGQVIGTVGHTGRATGPHLHWGVSLNDARVDPLWFVSGALRGQSGPPSRSSETSSSRR
ncbi:MAG: M23 family metallopeptidase [Gammaproteobacteria bacterium]|nr:MAG: M23 family metallopeptidase [Gammaproteobacteria bacterium]